MEWVFRYYGRSLKQSKYPLPPRYYMVEFYVCTNAKDLVNNLKLQGCPIDLYDKVKELVTDYWGVFYEDGFSRTI